ncbi:MAG: phosphate acyltransferase PlsX [Opitutales bacterium]
MSENIDTKEMKIAIDAMGSDNGPVEFVAAIAMYLKKNKDTLANFVLFGQEPVLKELLAEFKLEAEPRVSIVHAEEVITMQEKPMKALKAKKNSSMLVAIDALKKKEVDVLLSCSNTGALMAGGTLKLRPLFGVERPALATVMPSDGRNFVMLDVGANPSPKEIHFLSNAILGSNYAKVALGKENPKVGLLTIGTEEGKGNEIVQKAHNILKEAGDAVNYEGLIEGFDVFCGDTDVVLCDGFTGNILLKTSEGLFTTLKNIMKKEFTKNIFRWISLIFALPVLLAVKKKVPVEKMSGAPLLGLNELIIKGHGSSKRKQILGALQICIDCVKNNLNEKIKVDIINANAQLNKEDPDEEE